jgi:hypothetical protein
MFDIVENVVERGEWDEVVSDGLVPSLSSHTSKLKMAPVPLQIIT